MSIKVSYFRSCCFCVPLRGGLLTLGYICLVCNSLLLCLAAFISMFVTLFYVSFAKEFPPVECTVLLPVVLICEVTFYVFIILAGHENNERLLKKLLPCGLALWIFTFLYSVCICYRLVKTNTFKDDHVWLGTIFTVVISEPILLGYTLLLARSLKISSGVDNQSIVFSKDEDVADADLEQLLPTTLH